MKSKSNKPAPLKRNKRVLIESVARTRAARRRAAVEKASRFLRASGVSHERGDSLVIAHQFKTVIAFDSADLLEGIQKHASRIESKVVHIPAELFRKPAQFNKALSEVINAKPVYFPQSRRKVIVS